MTTYIVLKLHKKCVKESILSWNQNSVLCWSSIWLGKYSPLATFHAMYVYILKVQLHTYTQAHTHTLTSITHIHIFTLARVGLINCAQFALLCHCQRPFASMFVGAAQPAVWVCVCVCTCMHMINNSHHTHTLRHTYVYIQNVAVARLNLPRWIMKMKFLHTHAHTHPHIDTGTDTATDTYAGTLGQLVAQWNNLIRQMIIGIIIV